MVATIGLLAGLPQDHREAVLNRPTLSNAHFVQDCNAWYLSSHQSHSKASHKFHNSQSYNSFQPNYRSGCSSQIGNTNSTPHYSGQTSQQPNQNPYQHPNQHSLSPSFNPRPQPTPQPRRDLASVACFKCNRLGHYANTCPSHPTPSGTWQSNNTQAPTPQPNAVPNRPPTQPVAQTPTRPSPVPRNNSHSVHLINTSNPSEPESFVEPDIPQLLGSVYNDPPLNHFEDLFKKTIISSFSPIMPINLTSLSVSLGLDLSTDGKDSCLDKQRNTKRVLGSTLSSRALLVMVRSSSLMPKLAVGTGSEPQMVASPESE